MVTKESLSAQRDRRAAAGFLSVFCRQRQKKNFCRCLRL